MSERGERRKQTFNKANHHAKIYENVTGCSSSENVGTIGRFKKDKHLKTRTDEDKTNSEWSGKHNYKHSEKKRFAKLEAQEKDYSMNNTEIITDED